MKNILGEVSNSGGTVEYVNNIPGVSPSAPFYSQVVLAGDTAYLSGQIAFDPKTNKMVEGGVAAETEQVIDNIEGLLKGVNLSLKDVAKVSIYLTDMQDFSTMNEIYLRRFAGVRPARETVAVSGLALGAKIEITVTAYLGRA